MGQAKLRKAEIEQVKNKQYYLAEAFDTQTGKCRYMSMLAVAPVFDVKPVAQAAETMLIDFIEGRQAPDVQTKWHFFNWCFLQSRYGSKDSRVQTVFIVTDRKGFDQFNQAAKNNTTNEPMFFAEMEAAE